jgi:hypothetical protein
VQNNPTTLTDPSGEFNLLTPLLEAVTSFVSEALDAGSYLVKDVTTWRRPTPGYKNANRAATAALNAIFKKSEKEHAEYGGRIYLNSNGRYSYTSPATQGNATTVDVDAGGPEGSRIPAGTTNAGIYHTHETVPGYNQDQFSAADAQMAVREHVPSYIETPGGLIHEIDGTNATSYLTAPQYMWWASGPVPAP